MCFVNVSWLSLNSELVCYQDEYNENADVDDHMTLRMIWSINTVEVNNDISAMMMRTVTRKKIIYKWKMSCHSMLGWKWHISLSVMEFTRIPQRTHCGLLQTVSPQSHTTIMCKCQCQTHNSQISNKLSHCAVFSNCKLQLHVTLMQLQ